MKKICFLISSISGTGGTERVCSEITNKLASVGYQVTILSLYGCKPNFQLGNNVGVFSLFASRRRLRMQALMIPWKLRGKIAEIKPDVLVNVDSALFLFSCLAGAGSKFRNVVWEHFNFHYTASAIRTISRKLAARNSDMIIVLTQADREAWLRGLVCKVPICVFPNPSPFERIPVPKASEHIVLAVGRLAYQKGFDRLLRAWERVKCNNVSDWKLRIVGSGELEYDLKKQVLTAGISASVEFIQATDQIRQYYETAGIYCLSSRYEGFPMVLLEAQSYGLPIVSFDCRTGPREIVVNNSGLLVSDNDVDSLAEALLHLMDDSDLRERMAVNALNNAENYAIDNIIGYWLNLLEVA